MMLNQINTMIVKNKLETKTVAVTLPLDSSTILEVTGHFPPFLSDKISFKNI